MEHRRILIQLDSDLHPSVFDAVVAVDSCVQHLIQYGDVEPTNVKQLVHGAMFTRSPDQLKSTAVFIGGSNVAVGDAIGQEVKQTFFGPIRVSVMLDGNGSNTTAAAAVICAARHVELSRVDALVLGGTGPVGQRIARLLLRQGARVRLSSRDSVRAQQACNSVLDRTGAENSDRLVPVGINEQHSIQATLAAVNVIFCCGAAGATLLTAEQLRVAEGTRVAIDLNAVPPAGIEGISATDKAVTRNGRTDYGAIGAGGLKMKIHRAAISALFTRNDLFLDAEEIFQIGQQVESGTFS